MADYSGTQTVTLKNPYVVEVVDEVVTKAAHLSVPDKTVAEIVSVKRGGDPVTPVPALADLAVDDVVTYKTFDAATIAAQDKQALWNTGLNIVSGKAPVVDGQVGPILVKNHISQVPVYGSRNLYLKLAPGDEVSFTTDNHNEAIYYAGLAAIAEDSDDLKQILEITVKAKGE